MQMDIHNLCVCFAPSIFTLPSMIKTSPLVKTRATSFRTRSSSASRTPPSSITSSGNKEVTETMVSICDESRRIYQNITLALLWGLAIYPLISLEILYDYHRTVIM